MSYYQSWVIRGYTFLELTLVLLLVGLMMTIAVPRFQYAILTDDLKRTTRKMVGTIRNLRNEAVRKQEEHNLHFDLDANLFWCVSATMTEEEKVLARERASLFPGGVHFIDVWFRGKGKKMAGETVIRFNKRGYVPHSVIHLGCDDGRGFTMILRPFLSGVRVLEGYMDLEYEDIPPYEE
ncbi:MAG: hypothetical protein SV775_02460 [Thermodesulfobacteriota bacterium]|nr:hypothetical protein [Thermodesulfobacteriota bacterium]